MLALPLRLYLHMYVLVHFRDAKALQEKIAKRQAAAAGSAGAGGGGKK